MRIILPCLAAMAVLMIAAPVRAGTFTVVDDRASAEISEVSRLYVDGHLAATFRLDPSTQSQTRTITTSSSRLNHDYALCGEITIRTPDGRRETHQVSSEGLLNRPDGRVLQAVGSDDFTDFYLVDPDDPNASEHHPGNSGVCISPSV